MPRRRDFPIPEGAKVLSAAIPAGAGRGGLPAGPPGRWTVEIPGYLPTYDNILINSHWAKANRLKARDKRAIGLACLAAGVTRAVGRRRVLIRLCSPRYAHAHQRPDPYAAHKSTLDALAACDALVDDATEWVEAPPATCEAGRKATVIELEDC
jgi:hypothetical protein